MARTSQFGLLHSHFSSAIAIVLEKHGIACDLMHGFNWDKCTTGKPTERLALIPAGQEHILEQEDGKKRGDVSDRAAYFEHVGLAVIGPDAHAALVHRAS